MAPREQFQQLATALDRRKRLQLMGTQAAVVQAPLIPAGLALVWQLRQGQRVLGQIRRNARVEKFHFAGFAFERCIQTSPEHIHVALGDRIDRFLRASELGQKPVAEVELADQCAALAGDLTHFPLAAAVEQRQLTLVPFPLIDQPLQQQPLPAVTAVAGGAREFLVHLQVQTAAYQFQPLGLTPRQQVFLDAPVHHHVRVQLVEVGAVGEHGFLEAHAQALHMGVLAGINLGQQ